MLLLSFYLKWYNLTRGYDYMNNKILVILLVVMCFGITGCQDKLEEELAKKPVIYLYPETIKDILIELDYNGDLLLHIRR